MTKHPQCPKCAHYRITWDSRHPHGCKAMGFKSRELPSILVFKASGIRCQQFSPKPRNKPENPNRTA